MELSDFKALKTLVLYLHYFLLRANNLAGKWKKTENFQTLFSVLEVRFASLKLCSDIARSLLKLLRGTHTNSMNDAVLAEMMFSLRNIYRNLNDEGSVILLQGYGVTEPMPKAAAGLISNLDFSRFDDHTVSKQLREILSDLPSFDSRMTFCIAASNAILHRINQTVMEFMEPSSLNKTLLVRQIEFPPEYYQSGMSILSYFGTVIRKQYVDKHIKVRIEQANLNVKMIVETPEGLKDEIERTLEKYGMVVLGKMSPEAFFPDKPDALELKQQLSLAKVQLETQKELLALKSDMLRRTDERVDFLESQYKQLAEMVGTSLRMADAATSKLAALAEQAVNANNASLAEALALVKKTIDSGVIPVDSDALKTALATIRNEPRVFKEVYDLLVKGSISGVAGNALYTFIINLVSLLPK